MVSLLFCSIMVYKLLPQRVCLECGGGRGVDSTGSTSDCRSETQEEEEEQVKDPIVHQVCLSP